MKLHIKNIAKIKEAEIAVDGITVIAGENNTGKSTVGKVLFSLFDAFYDIETKIDAQRLARVEMGMRLFEYEIRALDAKKSNEPMPSKEAIDNLKRSVVETFKEANGLTVNGMLALYEQVIEEGSKQHNYSTVAQHFKSTAKKLVDYLAIPRERVVQEIIEEEFDSVFDSQVNSMSTPESKGKVSITIKGLENLVEFSYNMCTKQQTKISIQNKAILIDDPSILGRLELISYLGKERMYSSSIGNVKEFRLVDSLTAKGSSQPGASAVERVRQKDKLNEVFAIINKATEATVNCENGRYKIREKGTKYDIKPNNISYGLRTFIIIKMLLENGSINDKDILILDEPEIHLHPQWQILFAQLIVLLQKQFELSVVVTTHSPYFMEAVALYTRLYETDKTTRFYLSELVKNRAIMSDVTGDLEKIYKKMAEPYKILDAVAAKLQ